MLVRFGSVRFGSVRFASVRFGSVRFGSVAKKGGQKNIYLWCPPTHAAAEPAKPAGSVGFGGVRRGAAGCGGQKRAKIKKYVVVSFVVRFGSAGFGGVRRG